MSIHAIIAKKNEDGTIIGALQWNDGQKLKSILSQNFDSLKKVDELISYGRWASILTKNEADELDDLIVNIHNKTKEYSYVVLNGMYIKIDNFYIQEDKKPKIYANIQEAMNDGCDYLYLFDSINCTWKVFK